MLEIHKDSHLDHGLTQAHIDWILEKFKDKTDFFKETVALPMEMEYLPCGLYGPIVGDLPVQSEHVIWQCRGKRTCPSRLLLTSLELNHDGPRLSHLVSVIAGPHDGKPCVLYTAFGGPITPREIHDPIMPEEMEESVRFWSQHALTQE